MNNNENENADSESNPFQRMTFQDLAARYGDENAKAILCKLESFEGINAEASSMNEEERWQRMLDVVNFNIRLQTRH
jgi:hypothetical protein